MAETDENQPPMADVAVAQQEDGEGEEVPASIQRNRSGGETSTSPSAASAVDDVSMDTEDAPALTARNEPSNPLLVDFPKVLFCSFPAFFSPLVTYSVKRCEIFLFLFSLLK